MNMTLEREPLKILLVEDNPGDARLLREILREGDDAPFELVLVERLKDAVERLRQESFDVVLSDLSLPDAHGLETLLHTRECAPNVPIIVLTGNEDATLGIKAMQAGAQDYLTKGMMDYSLLARTIRYAIERQRMVVELEETRRQQLEMKDQFLSHVSHELRSPLTTIYQFTTILEDGLAGELNPEQREYLGIVLRNVNQLRTMIGDLLDITRAQSGKLTVSPQCISLVELIVDTVKAMETSAAARGITLVTEPLRYLPPIYADAARIRQVLINLIDNAIKFTPEQGVVSVRAFTAPEDPSLLQVEVADTGCGISPEGCERVFDRMYQEINDIESSRRGLGIGLYICKELVTRHGGRIWVRSQLGQGSDFAFTLPRCTLTELFRPVLQASDRLQARLALLTMAIFPRESAPNTRIGETIRQQVWRQLRHALASEQSVLLPRMSSLGTQEIYFSVTCVGENVSDLIASIRAQLTADATLMEAGLDIDITATFLEESLPEDPSALETHLEALAARIGDLMKAAIYERSE